MEAHVDPRTRTKVALVPGRILTSSCVFLLTSILLNMTYGNSIPNYLLTQLVLSNLSFVFVLISGKEWILDVHVSPLWLALRVLGCGCMGALVWTVAGSGGGSMRDIAVSASHFQCRTVLQVYQVVNFRRGFFSNCCTADCCIHGARTHVCCSVTSFQYKFWTMSHRKFLGRSCSYSPHLSYFMP